MKSFQAGYIVDNLHGVFEKNSSRQSAFIKLSKWCSHFVLDSRSKFEESNVEYPSIIAVLINLIQRGTPTKLNKYALDFIVEKNRFLKYDEKNETSVAVQYANLSEHTKELIFRSLHLIEPRLDLTMQRHSYVESWEKLGSKYEENFIHSELPAILGKPGIALIQLLTTQRTISGIIEGIKGLDKKPESVKNNFEQQRTDFSIEFPYYADLKPKGLVIEIDGPQHNTGQQIFLDTERDNVVVEAGWNNTLRINTSEFDSPLFAKKINNILVPSVNYQYVQECVGNYLNPIWEEEYGLEIMQLCLVPFAIARLQRSILEAIAHGSLDLDAKKWELAVLERDVPCAQLAVDDLLKSLNVLNSLSENSLEIPEIVLSVFSNKEFINSEYHTETPQLISDFDPTKQYDIVFDISVLERHSSIRSMFTHASEVITIRSVHYLDCKRRIAIADLIRYRPFCYNFNDSGIWVIEDKNSEKGLEYILQSLFRKLSFRQGQLPILHNSLQCKSVIGLLPTGGGKSLTYQISALLQPGICLVIDPIRSLMKDQVDNLNRNLIDSCIYINSTLQGNEKRKAMQRLGEGQIQFVFISPERLQMEEFRNLLDDMNSQGLYFSYCVIDEAHCVSEWGHDFRTAYLRLGENAIRYCKTKNLESIALFGLTATASYDVLADVQRELSGNDERRRLPEDSVIRAEYTKRHELQFIIEEVTFPTAELKNIWDLKKTLSANKQSRTERLIKSIPETIHEHLSSPKNIFSDSDWETNENGEQDAFLKMKIENYEPSNFFLDNANAGLIFCPHTKGSFGVTDKFKVDKNGEPVKKKGYYDFLKKMPEIKAGYFMGSGNESDDFSKTIEVESFENQDKFIEKELNLMVATKAFGMGIDKENIRYTIHVNYPGSIESYVQEAGRAGRDRKMAISFILFNDQNVYLPEEEKFVEHDMDINMYFHLNSFKGVAKELAVLDELLTEVYFPDRTFQLENLIHNELEESVRCNYWEGGANKRLYVNFNFSEPLGFLNLVTLESSFAGSVNPPLSAKVFPLLKNYIESQNLKEPVHLWLQHSDKEIGIEQLLKNKKVGEQFELTIGFFNNTKERVKTIANWLQKVVHPFFNEQKVQKMRANCNEAKAFIEEVCEHYTRFTKGKNLEFESFCNLRDQAKGNPIGTAYSMFMALFNGYRDKMDTEKAIYRLSTLGIIDDYTVNFSSNTFTLKGEKKPDKVYLENIHRYLLKYYSEKSSQAKLKYLKNIDEPTNIRKALNFLVNFVYSEIQKKRELAIHDMKSACHIGLEKGSIALKEFIDLYFNSKYARTGYSYVNINGEEVNASLTDLTNNGINDYLEWVWLFMEIVEEDPKAGQIDNIKHLRGATTRMLNNQPDSYTLLLLNVFTLYMLEYKNPRYLQEAENILSAAFSSIQEKESDWSEEEVEDIYYTFIEKVLDKNGELEKYMDIHNFSFDFDSIMISRLLAPLQKATNTLKTLNRVLN